VKPPIEPPALLSPSRERESVELVVERVLGRLPAPPAAGGAPVVSGVTKPLEPKPPGARPPGKSATFAPPRQFGREGGSQARKEKRVEEKETSHASPSTPPNSIKTPKKVLRPRQAKTTPPSTTAKPTSARAEPDVSWSKVMRRKKEGGRRRKAPLPGCEVYQGGRNGR
jgi:hypothetical protein